jgi:predicted RNA-binding Zn-ribbon protein involved in translation (DUF1610 family)
VQHLLSHSRPCPCVSLGFRHKIAPTQALARIMQSMRVLIDRIESSDSEFETTEEKQMPLHECGGADRKKPNVPEEVECPHCGAELELWSHDTKAKCPACAKTVTRAELSQDN